jgi:hypothetical protein
MVATCVILRRDGHIISWDSVSNDELALIKQKVKERFGLLYATVHDDGRIYLNLRNAVEHLNKEFPITVDAAGMDITAELVGSSIARKLYKEANVKQSRETSFPSRYLRFVPRDQTPAGFDVPPAEPAEPIVRFVLWPTMDIGITNYCVRNLLITYLGNSARKLKIVDDGIEMPAPMVNKLKGGTLVFSPPEENRNYRLYIK